jgi:O-antigen/teichoic acid export membrane protein
MNKKRFVINLLSSILVFAVNLIISLRLSPFIVSHIGADANGFVTVSNNFISYASVLADALNTLFGRYLSIAFHKKNFKEASIYYSSVFVANCLLSLVLGVVVFLCTLNLNSIMSIPEQLYADVCFTLILTFVNYGLGLIFNVFTVCTFVRNRLELSSLKNLAQSIFRAAILVAMFACFSTHIYFVPLAGVFSLTGGGIINIIYAKKLLPDIHIKLINSKFRVIFKLIREGVWASLQSFNKILETGLDLIITNNLFNSIIMGYFSIAKTIPNVLVHLTGTLANVFSPTYVEQYARDDKEGLKNSFLFSIKFMAFMLITPMAGFIVFGEPFYSLWQPTLNREAIHMIQTLSVLTVLPTLFNGYVESLYYANILTNKIKKSVLITFSFSLSALGVEILLLLTTDLGVYAVAGTSAVFMSVRCLIFTPLYSAHILKMKINVFYPPLIKAICMCMGEIGIFFLIRYLVNVTSWDKLLICAFGTGCIGYLLAYLLILNHHDRRKILGMFKKKANRKLRTENTECILPFLRKKATKEM